MNLKWRLALIAGIPSLFFTFLSLRDVMHAWQNFKDSEHTHQNLLAAHAASELVHETQIERGKTVAMMAGTATEAEVEAQRAKATEKSKAFLEGLDKAFFPKEIRESAKQAALSLSALRQEINAKALNSTDVAKRYSSIVGGLLRFEVDTAAETQLTEVQGPLYSMAVFEDAKENGGYLRNTLNEVASKNIPLTDAQFARLIEVKGKVEGNLASPSLIVSNEVAEAIKEFKNLKEWKEANQAYKTIITNSERGNFGLNPKEIFAAMTGSMNYIAQIVRKQEQFIFKKIDEIKSASQKSLTSSLLFLLIAFIGLGIVTYRMIQGLSTSLRGIADHLRQGAFDLTSAAEGIASSSVELSESATEQAAALQETVSSVDEINAMISRNSEAANKSREVSAKNQEATVSGKKTVDEMIQAITRINGSNNEIMTQVKQSNQEISEIVKVISEIGNKTKVINDIVFQTKLLSFNASVEAARAGEHGKGFAVVAEEVGNLAQMSGNAAKEISGLLDGSIQKVESIVKETQGKMDRLVEIGQREVQTGTHTAKKCGEALDEILKNVSIVNEMVNEIARASNEQEKGVQEVTKAMSQLDQVTQQNSTVARNSSTSAEKLSGQAENLKTVVIDLVQLINGGNQSQTFDNSQTGAPHSSPEPQKIAEVVRLNRPVATKKPVAQQNVKSVLKNGRGSAAAVPAADDPRFEEI